MPHRPLPYLAEFMGIAEILDAAGSFQQWGDFWFYVSLSLILFREKERQGKCFPNFLTILLSIIALSLLRKVP